MQALSFFILFLSLTTTLAHADVYRCGEADGAIIFTDNPANFSSACREEIVSDVQPLKSTPSPPGKAVKTSVSTQRPATVTEQKQQKNAGSTFDDFKEEAEILVGKFVSTRKRVFRSTGSRSRHRAQRKLKDIRLEKSLLLSEIDQTSLNGRQKKQLQATLSSITD